MSNEILLLPPNADLLEKLQDKNTNRLLNIDVNIIRRTKKPYETDIRFLPFLAWERGVDLWYDDWPEWKKRRITNESYWLKGLKGTLPGIDAYLFFVDAKIVDYIIPPQQVIARKQNPKRVKKFKSQFAQLRLYTFGDRGNRPGSVAKTVGSNSAIVGRMVARGWAAPFGKRAVIYDKGKETEIKFQAQILVSANNTSLPVRLFSQTGIARTTEAIVGKSSVGCLVAHASQVGKLFTLDHAENGMFGAAIHNIVSSIKPLSVQPETIYERHDGLSWTPVAGVQPKTVVGKMVVRSSRAITHVYDRWYLFDETRVNFDAYGQTGPTVGRMMPSLKPFHAFLRVDAQFKRRGRATVVGKTPVGKMVSGHPSDKIDRVGRAIYRSKSLRDDIRFTTKTHRQIEIGDLSFNGEFVWGAMVPINRRAAT